MTHVRRIDPTPTETSARWLEIAGCAGLVLTMLLVLNSVLAEALGGQLYLRDPNADLAAAKFVIILPALATGLLVRAKPGHVGRRVCLWLVSIPVGFLLLGIAFWDSAYGRSRHREVVRSIELHRGDVVDVRRVTWRWRPGYADYEVRQARRVVPGIAWGRGVYSVSGTQREGGIEVESLPDGKGVRLLFPILGDAAGVIVQ